MADSPHVLITGAAGFIGAAVVRILVRQGVQVTGIDDLSAAGSTERLAALEAELHDELQPGSDGTGRLLRLETADASDPERLVRLLLSTDQPPTSLLHLAGRVGVRTVLGDPVACEEENLASGRAVAAAVRMARGEGRSIRVIAASTSEVYAESSEPLAESSAKRPLVAEGRWRYAASKLASEGVLDTILGDAVHLRFFNVVGPGQDGSSGMVLPRFAEAALAGEDVPVHGDGAQVRTFAHVEAVALDVAQLAAPEAFGRGDLAGFSGPLNVGGSARATIMELAEAVTAASLAHTGAAPAKVHRVDPTLDVGSNFEDVRHRVPDLSLLSSLGLGRAPWPLSKIVSDTVGSMAAASCGSLVS